MSTTISLDRTVGQLAVEVPDSIRVFEAWKIDYCCGGSTPLAEACRAAGRTVEQFEAELGSLAIVPAADTAWPSLGLTEMAARIVKTYHEYTRQELRTFDPLAAKVFSVHGQRRPELAEVLSLVRELTADLLPHMLKEEQVLFPYVGEMEGAAAGRRERPTPFFGTVRNPVRMMMMEHDRVGELLARVRQVSGGYAVPADACFSYRELYRRLAELERLTHEHIHIENNLYFPRAVALEDQVGQAAPFGASGCCGH